MPHAEQEIIRNLRQESSRNEAFKELVLRYQERLYWHIRKIVISHEDADDVLQNTLMKAWKNIGSFREESSLFTWLYRIATNESLTFINSRKQAFPLSIDEVNEVLEEQTGNRRILRRK